MFLIEVKNRTTKQRFELRPNPEDILSYLAGFMAALKMVDSSDEYEVNFQNQEWKP